MCDCASCIPLRYTNPNWDLVLNFNCTTNLHIFAIPLTNQTFTKNSKECLGNSCVGYNLKIYYTKVKGQVLYLFSCGTI